MITATRTPGGRIRLHGFGYPASLAVNGFVDIRPSEAERLIKQLQSALEGHVIRVKFIASGAGMTGRTAAAEYCYTDASGTVKVGDLVEVPTRYAASNIAKVVGIGRLDYDGPLSDVIAKLDRTVVAPEAPF